MKRTYTKTELGPGYGLITGGALGAILLALTGSTWWLSLPGVGLVVGAIVGQLLDRSRT